MSDNFHRAHAFTAHWEGGFSDHPADTGGLTAYGASLKFVQGIAATQQGRDWLQRIGFRLPVNKASMRSVTPDMAEAMFKREFWDRLRLDDMPFRPACALYDAAVNSGCAQSVKLAQRGYNACVGPYGVKIEVDGILRPRTRASLACDTDALIRAVIQARRDFYEGLARDKPSRPFFWRAGSTGPMPWKSSCWRRGGRDGLAFRIAGSGRQGPGEDPARPCPAPATADGDQRRDGTHQRRTHDAAQAAHVPAGRGCGLGTAAAARHRHLLARRAAAAQHGQGTVAGRIGHVRHGLLGGGMDNGHFITVLLGVIFGLWVLLLGVGGYCLKRISDKLDDLVVHREGCIMAFADRDGNSRDHREFFRRTDDHERRLTRLEAERERKG